MLILTQYTCDIFLSVTQNSFPLYLVIETLKILEFVVTMVIEIIKIILC